MFCTLISARLAPTPRRIEPIHLRTATNGIGAGGGCPDVTICGQVTTGGRGLSIHLLDGVDPISNLVRTKSTRYALLRRVDAPFQQIRAEVITEAERIVTFSWMRSPQRLPHGGDSGQTRRRTTTMRSCKVVRMELPISYEGLEGSQAELKPLTASLRSDLDAYPG